MNINRRTIPGMRVRKFHNGGKGPGHPHEGFVGYPTDDDSSLVPEGWSEFHEESNRDLLTTTVLDSILDSGISNAAHKFSEFRDAVKAHEGGYQGYSAKQIGGGPGRGAYQFDKETAKTAYKRLKKIANDRGYSIPKLSKDDLKNMDQVDPEIQDLLFTAHFAKDTKCSVETVLSDKSQWADQWAKGHWKGGKEDYNERIQSFQHSLENIPEKASSINPAFLTIFPETINNE